MKRDDTQAPEAESTAPAPAAGKVARIRVLKTGTSAKGFTFGKGVVVPGVPLTHAEYLRDQGAATILSIG